MAEPTHMTEEYDNVTKAAEEPDSCDETTKNKQQFILLLMFPLAVLTLIGLSFMIRRTRLWPRCCWSRPAVIHPINLIDQFKRRWQFVPCFLVMVDAVMDLFNDNLIYDPLHREDKVWMSMFGWLSAFVKILNVLLVSVVYYPFFACVSHRKHIAANVVGFLYVLPMSYFEIDSLRVCTFDDPDNERTIEIASEFVNRLPAVVCYAIMLVAYGYDFVWNIRRRLNARQNASGTEIENIVVDPNMEHCLDYVRHLMKKREKSQTVKPKRFLDILKNKLTALIDRFRYEPVVGFRYPLRLICTLSVSGFTVVWLLVRVGVVIDPVFLLLADYASLVKQFIPNIDEYVRLARIILIVSLTVSGLLQLIFIAHILITYKRRVLKLFQGCHEWHAKIRSTPASMLVSSMKYPGYQFAFFIFGFAITTIEVFFVVCIITFFIVIPIRDRQHNFMTDKLSSLWPALIVALLISRVQTLLCKYAFLQDKGAFTALNNRRLFHVMNFFMFFMNALLGIFAVLKRLLTSVVIGSILLPRLDFVLLMRGFEGMDNAHVTYLSLLMVDVYLNHPVLKTFVELLLRTREANKSLTDTSEKPAELAELLRKKRVRNRWLKLLTLFNNPSLVIDRLQRTELKNRFTAAEKPQSTQCAFELTEMRHGDGEKTDGVRTASEQHDDERVLLNTSHF